MSLSVGVPAAHAAIITVNTTADELNSDGDCSLREAIAAANTNLPVDACPPGTPGPIVDVITFGVTGTITLTMGQLTVTDDLMIDGPGAASLTVSGNHASRVLEVVAGVTLDLEGVTVANGSAFRGGGIANSGTLSVRNSIFSGNSADNCGGGLYNPNSGVITITDSSFTGNTAGACGGVIYNPSPGTVTFANSILTGNSSADESGAISSFGTLTIAESTLTRNSAAGAGGVMRGGGSVTITNSTLSENSANQAGGIWFHGTVTITNSTLSGNSAAQEGGAMVNGGGSSTTITNSTFSGNSAQNGGGIFNAATLSVTNSTFSGNSASGLGGGIFNPFGTVVLRNTIVANSPSGGNCAGVIIDGLGNLQYPGLDCGPTIPSADPLLGPLAANDGPAPDPPDGPTKTHALLPGSPAIDTAVLASCPPTDQRGVLRPQGAGCDIGSFELEVAACPPGDGDLDDDGLDDGSEDFFGSLLNDDDSDDDGIRDGNDDGDDDGEDDEDEDDGTDPCPEDGDGDGEDDEDEDDEEDDD